MIRLCLLPLLFVFVLQPISSFCDIPGTLDVTFGTGGRTATDFGGGIEGALRVAVQGDGKIVAAGYSTIGGLRALAVARYEADGTPDGTFGTGGKVTTPIPNFSVSTLELLLQNDGKIVLAAGSVGSTLVKFAMVRYQANGTLDSGFGTAGKVTMDSGTFIDVSSAALQNDGKIVVAGRYVDLLVGFDSDVAVARFNANGSLDSGFGAAGKVITSFGSGSASASSVLLQGDGKIVIAGDRSTDDYDFDADVVLARYLTNGTLDSTFGSGGKVITHTGGALEEAGDVELQSDGKLVVAGLSVPARNRTYASVDVLVLRYASTGALDADFGVGGRVTTDFQGSLDIAESVVLDSDGNIVVAGLSRFQNLALARYQPGGGLDSTFGTGGKVTNFAKQLTGESTVGVALRNDGKILVATPVGTGSDTDFALQCYNVAPLDPPAFDSVNGLPSEPMGTSFLGFGTPVVDSGVVAGGATIKPPAGRAQTVIYGDDGSVQVRTGGMELPGQTFLELGDPVFAGEGLGFAGMAEQTALSLPPMLRVGRLLTMERALAIRPGGKLSALYSRLNKAAGIKRLAAQADPAPGGGQFAKFASFGLPRTRGGLIYAASLHRSDDVTAKNDFGVWRERIGGGESDLLLRTGKPVAGRTPTKLVLMPPVANATDQRLTFAPDGGIAAMAKFDDGQAGIVTVAADGTAAVPLASDSAVPDEAGNAIPDVKFSAFTAPATGSGGKVALLAALKAASRGISPPPAQAIFSNRAGAMTRVMARGDDVPGRTGLRFGALGQPAMGKTGMIGLIATLTGKSVTPATKKAIIRVHDDMKTVVARLGDQAPGYNTDVVFREFISMIVTDTEPARVVFTGKVGGPGVNGNNNVGLWSSSTKATALVMRKGGPISVDGATLTVRVFEALQAPRKSVGQGRSTDESGFVTAKAKLSDGRQGVLRIPLP